MDRWAAMSTLANLLLWESTTRLAYERISRRLSSPLVTVGGASEAREVAEVYEAFPRKPVRFFLANLYQPSEVIGPTGGGHAVGLVADLARSNTFHYFDPHGSAKLFRQGPYDYLRFVFNALRPVVQDCQRAGHLMSTPTPFSFHACNTYGLQQRQVDLFRTHGVEREKGMCAFMTTLTLFEFERHEGHLSLKQISDGLATRPVEAMMGFAEAVWPDVADIQPTTDVEFLSSNQMQRLVQAVAASANTASVAARRANNSDSGVNEANSARPSGSRPPRRKRTWAMAAANVQAVADDTGEHAGYDRLPPDSQAAKRRAKLTTADEETSRQRLGSKLDVAEELDWLFFNCERGKVLEVRMTERPAAVLGVAVVGWDKIAMQMLTNEAPQLRERFETDVEGLVSMLEFQRLEPSVLSHFGPTATVASRGQVFWSRANGYHLQTMERSGWFPFV